MRSPFALSFAFTLIASLSTASPKTAPKELLRPTVVHGSVLPIANLWRAGSDGAEWALPGGSTLSAAPGAELRVLGKPQDLDLGAKGKVPGYAVILKKGFVRARVPEGARSAIVIAAPKSASVLVVSGETSVNAGAKLGVATVSGTASFSTDGKSYRALAPGMLELLDNEGSARRALLGSPKSLTATRVLLSSEPQTPLGKLAWDAVSGAAGYRVELREAGSDRLALRTETLTPALPAGAAELAPGSYRLRIVSIDESGMESGAPLEHPVNVVSFALPRGGFVDGSGALRIPAGSRVGLSHVEGVELAEGFGERFGPAPPVLELSGSEPRLLRLRARGDGDGRSLWLMPRKAIAHVEFAPHAPRWPSQPLEIRVRIEDESGVAAEWVNARAKVRVGVDPVDVAFSSDGSSLKGTLPARTGSGPWVVRVEVSDQNGAELGRDFVEVAAR